MIRYTLLIEEDRQRAVKPGNGYSEPVYETQSHVLAKIEGETATRGTALDAIIAVAKDLQPVRQPAVGGMAASPSLYTPQIRSN